MKRDRKSLTSYAAGILDGEGCIMIVPVKSSKNICYTVEVQVSMADGRILDLLHGAFGGKIMISRVPNNKHLNKHTLYRWYMYGDNATKFLKNILPFLRIKKRQAEIAIRLQSRINVASKKGLKLSDHERELRKKLYDDCKREKEIFVPPTSIIFNQA